MAIQSHSSAKKAVITIQDVINQIWLDVSGKETQEAATYSYYWLAGQVAHTGLLIAGHILLYNILSLLNSFPYNVNNSSALILIVLVAFWEIKSVIRVMKQETKFPSNKNEIKKNAFIAAFYMWIGVGIGWASYLPTMYSIGITLFLIGIFLLVAFPELKLKIIWQKAGLPYLSRLPSINVDVSNEDKNNILSFIKACDAETGDQKQIIIFGKIGTGRTRLSAAIGTELALLKTKLRYLGLDKLLELFEYNAQYSGPKNINYWRWSDCGLLVIDDVELSISALKSYTDGQRQLLDSSHHLEKSLNSFSKTISSSQIGNLSSVYSVWVVGDAPERELWIRTIRDICQAKTDPLIVDIK